MGHIYHRKTVTTLLCLFFYILVGDSFAYEQNGQEDKHPELLNPIEEQSYFLRRMTQGQSVKKQLKNMFPFMFWNECHSDDLKGTFVGYPCSERRMISNILYRFLNQYFYGCVDQGARRLGLSIYDYSITHAGIFADQKHSPKSLHSEGRAIDIKSIELYLTSGQKVSQDYFKSGTNAFYQELRRCWGEVLNQNNTCPYIANRPALTGSIGKENPNHQKHLHLSVPYCINYAYSDLFFRR